MADDAPPQRQQTLRFAILEALRADACTLLELSQQVRARESDLPEHLSHLARSLEGTPEQLTSTPARCIACGFVFAERKRLKKPGRCPRCRSTRIAPPRYAVTSRAG